MRVLLRRMEALGGLMVAADEALELDRVKIGRGTDQDVQLPDMRVTLAHAEIRPQVKGWRIECRSENPVWVNGRPVVEGPIEIGDALNFGRFRIHVRPPTAECDLLLEIEEHLSARQVEAARKARVRVSLADAGLRKRRWAWGLAALIVLVLFVLPAALRYGAGGDAGASLDSAWQAGPASAAHNGFIQDCDTCHQKPFAAVRNDACLACHKQTAHHSDHPGILEQGGMTEARCASCHLEHTGRNTLIARSPSLCTDCHAEPAARFPDAHLVPASSFDDDHPGFTLSLASWENDEVRLSEVPQATPPGSGPVREQSHLKYPHDVHLAPAGISSPEDTRVLECRDCHRPMGASFAPIRMEDHCQSCHQLDFDPEKSERRLPHRAPGEVSAIILDHYARMALTGGVEDAGAPAAVRLLRRPGQVMQVEERKAALEWAQARAKETMDDVFSRRVCVECHDVFATENAERPWEIGPVELASSFLTGARFDHAAHRTEKCERCHEARPSKDSADVLVPPLANCRECHGDPGTRGRLGTACVDCHGFHIAVQQHFGAAATPE